jgi:nucleoside-diphosphate-sugar epimerase
MISKPLPQADMDHILSHTGSVWAGLRGSRLFITGGTGFFGRWLLESIAHANDALGCHIRATVLSRDPKRFLDEMPHLLLRREFDWLEGSPSSFPFPQEAHDLVLHMATSTSAHLDRTNPREMLQTKFDSVRRVLDFARITGARRLLLTSSGAVYGPQPADLERIPETYTGAPDPCHPGSAYGEGKRMVELICNLTPGIECLTARCFSFIGPHLPLDARFAAGNFLRDALAGKPINITGDGRAVRSYLYAADLVVWLLVILTQGTPSRAYNLGSDQALTIAELAAEIGGQADSKTRHNKSAATSINTANRYVPNISRARSELHLDVWIDLHQAISRSFSWMKTNAS